MGQLVSRISDVLNDTKPEHLFGKLHTYVDGKCIISLHNFSDQTF